MSRARRILSALSEDDAELTEFADPREFKGRRVLGVWGAGLPTVTGEIVDVKNGKYGSQYTVKWDDGKTTTHNHVERIKLKTNRDGVGIYWE